MICSVDINYIYQYLKEKNLSEAINDFPEIIPFSMNVQSLERTFVDKLFAIGDKYMNEMPERNSRHLYDLFFLWDRGGIEKNQLRETFEEVRLILAKDLEHNPSSAASVNFQTLLIDLLNTDFFQLDYEHNTSFLSTEVPNYNDMKVSLIKTINELDFL